MEGNDVNLIYQAILNWIKSKKQGAVYKDPLMNTSRRAEINKHEANITLKRYVTQAEKNFYLRYGMGDSITPRYNIINENKQYNTNRNMKRTIRLTEGELRGMISEAVRDVLSKHPNKRRGINEENMSRYPRYRGIPGTQFIYGGDMSDSIVVYKRHRINEWDIENELWECYKDYGYRDAGQEEPTERGFDEWIENVDKGWLKSCLDDIVWSIDGCP